MKKASQTPDTAEDIALEIGANSHEDAEIYTGYHPAGASWPGYDTYTLISDVPPGTYRLHFRACTRDNNTSPGYNFEIEYYTNDEVQLLYVHMPLGGGYRRIIEVDVDLDFSGNSTPKDLGVHILTSDTKKMVEDARATLTRIYK